MRKPILTTAVLVAGTAQAGTLTISKTEVGADVRMDYGETVDTAGFGSCGCGMADPRDVILRPSSGSFGVSPRLLEVYFPAVDGPGIGSGPQYEGTGNLTSGAALLIAALGEMAVLRRRL